MEDYVVTVFALVQERTAHIDNETKHQNKHPSLLPFEIQPATQKYRHVCGTKRTPLLCQRYSLDALAELELEQTVKQAARSLRPTR